MKKIIEMIQMENFKTFIERIREDGKKLQNEYLSLLYNNDISNLTIKKLNYIEKIA